MMKTNKKPFSDDECIVLSVTFALKLVALILVISSSKWNWTYDDWIAFGWWFGFVLSIDIVLLLLHFFNPPKSN